MNSIELPPQTRTDAIASLKRYFDENLNESLGDLPAGLFLNYILEEIGPAIYNRAIHDVQARLTQRLADLEGELYVDEFQYWPRQAAKRKPRR
jgi:uncharacterized protein (DUF2164 family)